MSKYCYLLYCKLHIRKDPILGNEREVKKAIEICNLNNSGSSKQIRGNCGWLTNIFPNWDSQISHQQHHKKTSNIQTKVKFRRTESLTEKRTGQDNNTYKS